MRIEIDVSESVFIATLQRVLHYWCACKHRDNPFISRQICIHVHTMYVSTIESCEVFADINFILCVSEIKLCCGLKVSLFIVVVNVCVQYVVK